MPRRYNKIIPGQNPQLPGFTRTAIRAQRYAPEIKTRDISPDRIAFNEFCHQAEKLTTEFIGGVIEAVVKKEKAKRNAPISERLAKHLGDGLEHLMLRTETMIKKRNSKPYETKLHEALTKHLAIITKAQESEVAPRDLSLVASIDGIRAVAILIKHDINLRKGHKLDLAHLGNCCGQIINRGQVILKDRCEVSKALGVIGLTGAEAAPATIKLVKAIEKLHIGINGSKSEEVPQR